MSQLVFQPLLGDEVVYLSQLASSNKLQVVRSVETQSSFLKNVNINYLVPDLLKATLVRGRMWALKT